MNQLYIFTNNEDTVIAENLEAAIGICSNYEGYTSVEEYKDDYPTYEEDWVHLDEDSSLSIRDDDDVVVTKTVNEWITSEGKGYLAGYNY